MPSARFYDESSFSFVGFRGDPDRKVTLSFYPYDWLETSLFYTSIKGREYAKGISQDYKDKGFNIKIRLKEEGVFPAIAIGLNDFAGTGFYSSEYVVASYGIGSFDMHYGFGWGAFNGQNDIDNPLTYFSDSFRNRPTNYEDLGGQIQLDKYFSGEKVSSFGGMSYALNQNVIIKAEYDPTITPGKVKYPKAKTNLNFGIDFNLFNNWYAGIAFERGNYVSGKFFYKEKFNKKKYSKKYIKQLKGKLNKYDHLEKILNLNNIGISSSVTKNNKTYIDITQNAHISFQQTKKILERAINDSGFEDKEVIVRKYKIAGLEVIDNDLLDEEKMNDWNKKSYSGYNQNLSLSIRPFIAGREDFLKAAIFLEHDLEYIFSENLFFSSNLKYSLIDNFDDLIYPPKNTYPNQVRSDVKKYLRNLGDDISIGRAQIDYFKTVKKNNHIMVSAGIFEEMFSGFGIEYLWYDPAKNYSLGLESFKVYKRDYNFKFGLQEFKNVSSFLNFYYRNKLFLPFDLKVSVGEYLAGDKGATFEFSRTFNNGTRFGFFSTFTNVTPSQFGEGTFDKGIFFTIPFGKNARMSNFFWRPLTKDPGAKLVKKNDLYSLSNKYRLDV